ncbi:AT-rich interactive domain-containing protein 5A [Tiliqua scincoides]|uniref:AT-rich interactive domain-containing protein 5A n=1 Tax=Tiliqua scincoides TaxID=71010 RepID=UPI003462DD7D
MAPSLKGKRKKKSVSMAENDSQAALGLCPEDEPTAGSPSAKESQNAPKKLDQAESPAAKLDAVTNAEPKSPAEESGDEQMLSAEKEEEQTFLVNLYKFMKERHTPIERVPHLGFKQINLFKIYKVVEKLGAYELVTGKRLWKNVYDMLGGSPGSTSAATCTRRHYERLVLPYVRHLKGEDDKPLPPVKPRKQYKVSKEPKGDKGNGGAEKKRVKKEKAREQALPGKLCPNGVSAPKPISGMEQTKGLIPHPDGQEIPESQPPDSCCGNCRAHSCSEAYKRLFSSFYFKGNHGIMSPLAKKKLLAQVSKAESLYCSEKHLSHCPEFKKVRSQEIPDAADPEAGSKNPSANHHHKEGQDSVMETNSSCCLTGPTHVPKANEGVLKGSPNLKAKEGPQKAEDGGSGGRPSPEPPVLTGYFHAYRSDIMKPISCHPLRGPVEYYPGFKAFSEASTAYQSSGKDMLSGTVSQKRQEDAGDHPEDLSRKSGQPLPAWKGDSQQPSAFQRSSPMGKRGSSPFPSIKASWVPPVVNLAKVSPQVLKPGVQSVSPSQAGNCGPRKQTSEADFFVHRKKLKAVSPFVKELECNSGLDHSASLSGQQGVAKPKAGFPATPGPQAQDMYKGTMLRLPVNFSSPGEHLKGQSPSLIPSLSVSPFIIPAFPTPLLTASVQPSDLCQPLRTSLVHYPTSYDSTLRQRLYPVATWHSQPTYASPHVSAFHRNTKL